MLISPFLLDEDFLGGDRFPGGDISGCGFAIIASGVVVGGTHGVGTDYGLVEALEEGTVDVEASRVGWTMPTSPSSRGPSHITSFITAQNLSENLS